MIRFLLVHFCLLNQRAESETETKDVPTYNQLSELILFLVAIKCLIAMQVEKNSFRISVIGLTINPNTGITLGSQKQQ